MRLIPRWHLKPQAPINGQQSASAFPGPSTASPTNPVSFGCLPPVLAAWLGVIALRVSCGWNSDSRETTQRRTHDQTYRRQPPPDLQHRSHDHHADTWVGKKQAVRIIRNSRVLPLVGDTKAPQIGARKHGRRSASTAASSTSGPITIRSQYLIAWSLLEKSLRKSPWAPGAGRARTTH